MRVEQKHRQHVNGLTVDHTQLQVLPMLRADRIAGYVAQTGRVSLTPAQERQVRKADKRAYARVGA